MYTYNVMQLDVTCHLNSATYKLPFHMFHKHNFDHLDESLVPHFESVLYHKFLDLKHMSNKYNVNVSNKKET